MKAYFSGNLIQIKLVKLAALPLAVMLVLLALQHGEVSAQGVCDIWVPAATVEKKRLVCEDTDPVSNKCEVVTYMVDVPAHEACRNAPDYYLDNVRAKDRMVAEIRRRTDRERAGGARFVMPSLADFGYRCPDAQGECPSAWVPSPGGSSGLSNPRSFAGGNDLNKANVYIQRISGAGIGDPAILADKPIDAVDIWGDDADTERKVCFLGKGRITYVDTDAMPRSKHTLSTTVEGEGAHARTCAEIPGRGQVIFLPL